jgi:hypothetical protein
MIIVSEDISKAAEILNGRKFSCYSNRDLWVGWKYYSRKAIKAIEMKQRPFLIR